MLNQIIVPSLGESVTEATVSKWLKQVGEKVDSDEPLVELETDKVNIEVPSPLAGTLSSIKVKEGDTVEVGTLLGVVQEGKNSPTRNIEKTSKEENQKPSAPSKGNKKKQIKKINLNKEEALKLVEGAEEENENDTLVLDTLADSETEDIIEKREEYIPPKTRKNLSPAVRKIVQESKKDI